nr:hypothetical protein [Spirochaetales bacterium]
MERINLQKRIEMYLKGEEHPVFRKEVEELLKREAWDELQDRFYQDLEFGTGGMRGVIGGGTNPIIYPSAGKHHDSLLPYGDHLYGKAKVRSLVLFFDAIWITLYEQRDRALGTEPMFIPPVRSYRFSDPSPSGDSSLAEGWHNVGRLVPQNGAIGSTSVALSDGCDEKDILWQVHKEACTPKRFPGCDPADDPCCQTNPLCDCTCPVLQPPYCEPVPAQCAE